MNSLDLIATTAFGLEAVVSRELAALGYHEQQIEDGKITFKGDALAVARTNLWLRSADRVLLQIGKFVAKDFDELFDQTKELPWSEWLPEDAAFPVTGSCVRSLLHNPPAVQSLVKKAIVESRKQNSQRHWFQETGFEYPIDVSILRDVVTLTIDTSGPGLHKRGYRKQGGAAPLKETLAAALVQLSFWNRERPFLDPFCGSGTIPIEAALIAKNRAPGLDRNFQAERWERLPVENWLKAREEARDLQISKPTTYPLFASDISPQAVQLTEDHARAAGVAGMLHVTQMDVLELKDSRDYGVIVTNPPYGERLGDRESAEAIYDDMADAFAPLKTWSIYVLTADVGFERFFRRRADRRRKLYNGRIQCQYYQYIGPRPPGSVDPRPEEGLAGAPYDPYQS